MNKYEFLFGAEYRPHYIVRDAIRYQLSQNDINSLRQNIFISFIINRANIVNSVMVLKRPQGTKFTHYHGDTHYDCWGNVPLPSHWDRSLQSLRRVANSLASSLTTINYNSILLSHPPGRPTVNSLLERSTTLGREGEVSPPTSPPPEGRRRGWGRQTPGFGAEALREALERR